MENKKKIEEKRPEDKISVWKVITLCAVISAVAGLVLFGITQKDVTEVKSFVEEVRPFIEGVQEDLRKYYQRLRYCQGILPRDG